MGAVDFTCYVAGQHLFGSMDDWFPVCGWGLLLLNSTFTSAAGGLANAQAISWLPCFHDHAQYCCGEMRSTFILASSVSLLWHVGHSTRATSRVPFAQHVLHETGG